MRIKNLIGSIVIDKSANEVGKVDDITFNKKDGKINTIVVILRRNILNSDKIEIDFSDIGTIGKYILLDVSIAEEYGRAVKVIEE